jgi:VWFA-related protein
MQQPRLDAPHSPALPPNTFTNADSFKPDSINIILLDQLNTSFENQQIARQVIIHYIAQKPPGAAFAIFTLRNDDPACVPYNYAQRSFGIRQAIVGGFDWSCSARGRLLMVQGITQDKQRLLAALDSKFAQPHATWLRDPLGYWPMQIDYYLGSIPEVYDTTMSTIADIAQFIQYLPGRKSLIWMSDSFDAEPIAQSVDSWFHPKFKSWEKTDPFSSTQMLHLTADRLAEARVALYMADLSGKYKDVQIKRTCPVMYDDIAGVMVAALNYAPTPVSKESEEWSCSEHYMKLSFVASQSGGRAFRNSRKVREALEQAISDSSNYYTLAYSPTQAKLTGKVRSIRIELAKRATISRTGERILPTIPLCSTNGNQAHLKMFTSGDGEVGYRGRLCGYQAWILVVPILMTTCFWRL